MNFLAHCLIPEQALSDTHPDLIAGGFIGDFLKGPVPDDLPPALADGVRLHRRIDAYSNQHPGIRASCQRFDPALRRFAPIFVDVVADHLLARHWPRFHPQPLEAFTAEVYRAIQPHVGRLPEQGQRFFDYMSEHDVLAAYRNNAAMERALLSITRRLSRPVSNTLLLADVGARLPELEADFLAYFPDLISHAAAWLAINAER